MPRRRASAAAASLLLAVGGAVVFGSPSAASASPLTSVAAAKPKPKPSPGTPTLPVPRATVLPELAIGGPKLAATGVVTDLPAGVPAPPKLRNVAWLLADMETGEVVAAKAPHARLLPASTLKTLTALTLIPKIGPGRVITATAADANADGTRVGVVPGQTYTARQLFQALLMSSGNDAAYALAAAAGGRAATLAARTARARELGAHDTVAKDPSGLDAPGQTSSAYDLALIGRAAMQLPDFRRYVTTKQAPFPGRTDPKTKKRGSYMINNHNKLLYNYDGTVGIKNGYTEAAHRTFISAVTRGGKTYLLSEMYGLDGSWRPQAAMFDWAFRYGDKARPVGTLVEPGTVTAPPHAPVIKDNSSVPQAAAPQDTATRATAAAAALPPGIENVSAPWVGVGTSVVIASLLLWLGTRAAGARRRHRARH